MFLQTLDFTSTKVRSSLLFTGKLYFFKKLNDEHIYVDDNSSYLFEGSNFVDFSGIHLFTCK